MQREALYWTAQVARSTRAVARFAGSLTATATIAIGIASCADDPVPIAPLKSSDSVLLARAFSQALSDSVALDGATLELPATLETSFSQDDTSVTVTEQFRLTKRPRQEFAAVERTQQVAGDRELLASMYSFENSRGELRAETEARFANIGFGADQRGILRDLLTRRLGLSGPILDSTSSDGMSLRIVRFIADGISGTLVLDHSSLIARSITVLRESSSIIGGYRYLMTVQLTRPDAAFRIPVAMHTVFHFDRLMSSGDGTLSMTIDTARASFGDIGDTVKQYELSDTVK